MSAIRRPSVHELALLIAALAFLGLLFKHLSYPLLWHDESDTVMFGQRVLEYGYPKVHGEKNVLYGHEDALAVGVDRRFDAYTGAPWGYYYFAAIGVALARLADDLYVKTALLRLPFAVIGALGLLILLLGVLPAADGAPRRRLVFATLYWGLAAYSVSLILHLREARYYGLLVFLVSALLAVYFRYHVFQRLRYGAYVALVTLLLFLIFNTFYPAYPVFLVAFGLHGAGRALFDPRYGLRSLLRAAVPLLVSLVTTIPLLFYFAFVQQVQGWLDSWDSSVRAYAANLWTVLANLLRYEFLAPALAARMGVWLLARRGSSPGDSEVLSRRRELSGFLLLFVVIYWLIVARTPFIWERYFISLSPIVSVMLLLDLFSLRDLLRRPSGAGRGRSRPLAAVVAVCLAVTCWIRIPEFLGRIHEITYRYWGPLDFVIPYLKEKYENAEDLVIATNYEDPVYMYYLGSKVTIGYYGADLARDLELQPDVIVPRPWQSQRDKLQLLAERAPYETTWFPVRNLLTNNIPSLSPRSPGGQVHWFSTQLAQGDEPRLVVLERRR